MTDTPTAAVAPGFLAFVAFFLLALALWFLMRNMNSRMRRMSYRQQQAHRGRDEPQVGPGELGRDRRDDDRSADERADDSGSSDAASSDSASTDAGSSDGGSGGGD